MLSPAFVPFLTPVLLLPLLPAPAQPHLPAGTTQPPSWPCCLNSNKPPLPVRQRAHREFPTLLFPQAGVTHDILSLPSNLTDEIPGAASHTPAPCWCSSTSFCSMWNNLRKCSSSFTSPISNWTFPCHTKLMMATHVALVLFIFLIGWFWSSLLSVLLLARHRMWVRAQTSPPPQKVRHCF